MLSTFTREPRKIRRFTAWNPACRWDDNYDEIYLYSFEYSFSKNKVDLILFTGLWKWRPGPSQEDTRQQMGLRCHASRRTGLILWQVSQVLLPILLRKFKKYVIKHNDWAFLDDLLRRVYFSQRVKLTSILCFFWLILLIPSSKALFYNVSRFIVELHSILTFQFQLKVAKDRKKGDKIINERWTKSVSCCDRKG